MPSIVTLQIYSGRPNPRWELTPEQARALQERLRASTERTELQPPPERGALGYQGFLIETVGGDGGVVDLGASGSLSVFDGVARFGGASPLGVLDPQSALESFLLGTGAAQLAEPEKQIVAVEIAKNAQGGAGSTYRSLPRLLVPPYDPARWNNDPFIRVNNNCYNYANDKITNTFAQPGRCSSAQSYPLSCAGITTAARSDGQISIGPPASTPAQGHYIALVIWPGNDYHWYRLDSNAMWSHKPGQTAARNTDQSNQPIADPRTCNRGPYTDFCGFFHCIPAQTCVR